MLGAQDRGSRADAIAKYPLLASGVVAHATYTIMVLAFALPMIITSRRGVRRITEAVGIMLVISLAYWIYTYVMDVIMRPTVDAFGRLVDLITGRAPPFYGVWQPWYGPEQQTFFIAWALVPSIVASYALFSIPSAFSMIISYMPPLVKKGRTKGLLEDSHNTTACLKRCVSISGLLGLVGTGINFLLRQSASIGGRYFYWLYLLMLPLSALVVMKASKKLVSLILCIALISTVSFYGIQDITLSGNTYTNGIGWADRKSWEISWTISSLLPSEVSLNSDPRVGTPLSVISFFEGSKRTYPEQGQLPQLIIIGMDHIGYRTLLGVESWYRTSSLVERAKGIVMSFGSYKAYYYG
jgi:hypothetical protein